MRRSLASLVLPALALALALGAPASALGDSQADAASPAGFHPSILDDDPAPLLGLSLGESFARFGAPASVSAIRGDSAWQDDVAFVYEPGYTLFLYGDRLWQLRFAKPYAGSIYGLFLGDDSDKALSILGQPFESGPGYFVYRMPYKSYPVQLRLALQEDRIADVYLYRADF
jgi:hypothetical protein